MRARCWRGVIVLAALVGARCGGSPTPPSPQTTSSTPSSTTLAAELSACSGGAVYQGNTVQASPSPLNISVAFSPSAGSPAVANLHSGQPAILASGTCAVTGSFATGTSLSGQIAGSYSSGGGGAFSGVLTTTGTSLMALDATGC